MKWHRYQRYRSKIKWHSPGFFIIIDFPFDNYMLKVNSRNDRTRCYLWAYLTPSSSVSIISLKQVNTVWVWTHSAYLSCVFTFNFRNVTVYEWQFNFLLFKCGFTNISYRRVVHYKKGRLIFFERFIWMIH